MGLRIRLLKFLGLDAKENYLWSKDVEEYSDLDKDIELQGTSILYGKSCCNIHLLKDANIEVFGELTGDIRGLKNNVVRIRGNFNGEIICKKLIVFNSSKIEGLIATESLIVDSDVQMNGKVMMKTED